MRALFLGCVMLFGAFGCSDDNTAAQTNTVDESQWNTDDPVAEPTLKEDGP